jgi:hypothetical protein
MVYDLMLNSYAARPDASRTRNRIRARRDDYDERRLPQTEE